MLTGVQGAPGIADTVAEGLIIRLADGNTYEVEIRRIE